MCGICGIYRHAPKDGLILRTRTMLDSMRYRGPDQQGFHAFDRCVIGANRLSIIDIKKGDQPVHNEDGTVWIAYNGEVYNFKELRQELASSGHRFSTDTDTEVIVHLYEQEGIDGFEKLNGMFAFAIYDEQKKRLLLARDRIGIKPLYYSLTDGVVFASEMKTLLALRDEAYRLNPRSIAEYLAYDYTPAPGTIVQNIFKLMPGTCLVHEDGKTSHRVFADLSLPAQALRSKGKSGERELEQQLEHLVSASVKDQMVADVPVGVLLSGGIDSSAIAYFASGMKNGINSFSISFDEPSFDESRYALLVSKKLGLRHYSETFTYGIFRELFDRITDFIDEPIADPSVVPTYFLSRLAGEYVKVVLSGEGGDEMFAGYPTYRAHRAAAVYNAMPEFIRKRIVGSLINRLPVSSKNFSFDFIAKKFIGSSALPVHERHIQWMSGFGPEELRMVLTQDILAEMDGSVYKRVQELAESMHGFPDPALANMLDVYLYLPDDLLIKVDRSTMAASIESRVPLLDNRLVDFSMSLPFDYKVRGRTQKYLLKRMMRGKLPEAVLHRKKKGFGIPLTKWLQNEFRQEAESLLSPDSIGSTGIVNPAYAGMLLQEHGARTHDHRKKLWPLLVLVKWLQKYQLKL